MISIVPRAVRLPSTSLRNGCESNFYFIMYCKQINILYDGTRLLVSMYAYVCIL